MLEVRLLGKFEVKYKNKLVNIASRPAQSLFAYLILSVGTAHRREKLAGLLWPDSLEETARENLRHALWRMRKALESASSTRFLHADDVAIGFKESSDYWFDVAELEKLSENATAVELIAVLLEYQGELLPGFYDEWVVLEREHLYSVFEHHMARLIFLLQEDKRWSEVLDWGERWIKLGQKPEPAFRALMTAHAAKGDMSKVAATYRRCLNSLKEFGVEPSKETRILYERLKAGRETFETVTTVPINQKQDELPNTNLPVPLTSFIGRKRELKEIIELLSSSRLLTLTGAGGVGKTRLAIQTARELINKFNDGVFWVELVGLSDANLIAQEIAQLVKVRDVPNAPLIEILKRDLAEKSLLLVLDNCEHLIEGATQTAEQLLATCPNLKILATSRERMGIFNEMVWHVPSLSENTSRQLFLERAKVVRRDFSLTESNQAFVVQICQRLDRIPLAIELAAARAAFLSVEEIARRLDDRFSLLTSGSRTALPRQQTLRATIDWSYDLLAEAERVLLHRLSVFAGGFTLEAAEVVCGVGELKSSAVLDLLGDLVNKSLVMVEPSSEGTGTRYRLLETIREYAGEKLVECGQERMVRNHHMAFYNQLATEAEPKLVGAESSLWLNKLKAEHDNLLAAIDWSLKSKNPDFALGIVGALLQWDAWHNSEGAERSLYVVRSPLTNRPTPLRARALSTAGVMQWFQGNFVQARSLLEEGIVIGKETGHKDSHYVWSLATLGSITAMEGDYRVAQAYLEEGLAEARLLGAWGALAVGFSLAYLGDVFLFQGDREQARQRYEESVARLRELKNKNFLPYPLRRLAELAIDGADYETAIRFCKESLELNLESGDQRAVVASLAGFAGIAAALGRQRFAVRLYGSVEFLLAKISETLIPADQHAYDRNLARIRSQIDEVAFNAIWAEGSTMTLEQAIEFALKETQA